MYVVIPQHHQPIVIFFQRIWRLKVYNLSRLLVKLFFTMTQFTFANHFSVFIADFCLTSWHRYWGQWLVQRRGKDKLNHVHLLVSLYSYSVCLFHFLCICGKMASERSKTSSRNKQTNLTDCHYFYQHIIDLSQNAVPEARCCVICNRTPMLGSPLVLAKVIFMTRQTPFLKTAKSECSYQNGE